MMLAFFLHMPGCPSWNGRWSGELLPLTGRHYVIVKTFRTKAGREKANELVIQGCYPYRWDDGWAARIDVREVDSKTARKLRKHSAGFCGYEWMVDSILRHDCILAPSDVKKAEVST